MAKASEKLKSFYKDFLDRGLVYEHRGELHLTTDTSAEALDEFSAFNPAENTVIVVGFPKCGNHLMLSMVDQLGIPRCEALIENNRDKLTSKPLDFNSKKEFDLMEKIIKEHKGLVQTPHCHASVEIFPKNFKGKIVYITRDTEAVAVSAFHFFNKLPWLNEYMASYGLKDDINVFARHVFNGEMLYGNHQEYDQEWKDFFAANPHIQVEWFKFEDVISNKAENIKRLAKFLNVENPDIEKIIENTTVKKTLENRKKAYRAAGELKLKQDGSPESFDAFSAFNPGENAVTVLGFPKSGNHMMLSILDQLGVPRCEALVDDENKDELLMNLFKPLDFNTKKEYDLIEKIIHEHKGPVVTNHCHASVEFFPKNYKGKIIFINRDIEAVAVSLFHFINELPGRAWLKEYMSLYGKDDINEFARHLFNGEMLYGDPRIYNQEWKDHFSANPNIEVECFKYEDVISNKAEAVGRLANFLNIEDPDIEKIIQNTSVESSSLNRAKVFEAAGKPFHEALCYREGKKETWKDVLTAETLAYLNK
ncbi:Oidioi.mRNA.OKI2018_I69.chr2.g5238.t1.cds [Oikopleura dioica]|uniref:Sulfotransferase n=1 Tax=Oikopleura dioica TaxID=34765 RepID=A0ABN7T6C0_OIKDI|nr:Oidioi.mRNA.OKI2018_I69.chr2.g5238.t1.cds [Oikopleura dioica]